MKSTIMETKEELEKIMLTSENDSKHSFDNQSSSTQNLWQAIRNLLLFPQLGLVERNQLYNNCEYCAESKKENLLPNLAGEVNLKISQTFTPISLSYIRPCVSQFYDIRLSQINWGTKLGVLVVFSDVSQKNKNLRQQLLNKYRNQMLACLSHNLKTPLNSILLYLQKLYQSNHDTKEQYFSNIKEIENNVILQQIMINNLLDYSSQFTDDLKIEFSSFLLKDIISEVTELFRSQLEFKQIKLTVKYDQSAMQKIRLVNDYSKMQQVLANLITNSVKFTPPKGTISLKIAQDDPNLPAPGLLHFTISDSGIGIPKPRLKTLYKIFQRDKQNDLMSYKQEQGRRPRTYDSTHAPRRAPTLAR